MARYVNADKLLEYLEKEAESEDVKYSFIGAGVQATISVIKTFPLEDVKPVVHAQWREYVFPAHEHIYCSHCNEEYYEDDLLLGGNDFPKYCPNCGAKMDEEVDT